RFLAADPDRGRRRGARERKPARSMILAPGATIGVLGGGQLGRMIAGAAARLGYRCHIFTGENESPAALVTPFATIASFSDETALARFAAAIDIVTFEFENVPA